MGEIWASHFQEILPTLKERGDLRNLMVGLILDEPIIAKGVSSPGQLERFRDIMVELAKGETDIHGSVKRAEQDFALPVGEDNGAEALVRLQFSRFYNQAVMALLMDNGVSRAFVPRCPGENPTSSCCRELAGKGHAIQDLYDRLVDRYARGKEETGAVVPGHPFCSHVVKPFNDF